MARDMRPTPGTVEAIVRSVRRGQRHVTRDPRRAIEGAVRQLLSLGRAAVAGTDDEQRTYRIDDLAQVSGVTVRNIRAYQSRGLLNPPTRHGRIVLFDDRHLVRLRIITSMLDRGYTTAHILEMLSAWESGRDLGHVLGLEGALVPAQTPDRPTTVTTARAVELAGDETDLERYIDAGLAERRGDRVRILRPLLLDAFAELRGIVALDRLLQLHRDVLPHLDAVRDLLIDAGLEQLGHRIVGTPESTSDDLAEVVEVLQRFRYLATTNVTATLTASIDHRIETLLTSYLAGLVETPEAETQLR